MSRTPLDVPTLHAMALRALAGRHVLAARVFCDGRSKRHLLGSIMATAAGPVWDPEKRHADRDVERWLKAAQQDGPASGLAVRPPMVPTCPLPLWDTDSVGTDMILFCSCPDGRFSMTVRALRAEFENALKRGVEAQVVATRIPDTDRPVR